MLVGLVASAKVKDRMRLPPRDFAVQPVAMTNRMPSAAASWIAGLAILALALVSPGVLNDGDSFAHIAAGDWIMAHGLVPHTDPFSFTRAGAPWVSHEWLAEILLAVAFRLAGWSGVVALTAIAVALAIGRMAHDLGRWLPAGAVLLLALLAAGCVSPGLLARPHILALPAFEAWVAGLVVARAAGRAPSCWLLPVMCLWANLHGGFIIGLALVAPLGLEAVLASPGARWATCRQWALFGLGGVAAALVTPHGLTGLLFPFRLTDMAELSMVGEWHPTDFHHLQPMEMVAAVGLYVGLTRRVRLSWVRLLVIAGLFVMAAQHTRHQMLIGMILPLLVAETLGRALRNTAVQRGFAGWWHPAGAVLAVALLTARLAVPIVRVDGPSAPITALAHVPADLRAVPVLNDYGFGGYLIFSHVRPFIDGRADLFGGAFLRQYAALTRPDRAVLLDVLRRYGIGWTILAPGDPAVGVMDGLPGWCRLYADHVAVVHTGC